MTRMEADQNQARDSGQAGERAALQRQLARCRDALAQSEGRFRSIVQATADGILIVDEDGRIRFANPSAERLFGRAAAELMGQELGTPAVAGETTEMDILRPGGRAAVVAELRASVTTWSGAPAQVISLRDITDRREARERERRLLMETAAREQAEEAGRRFRFLAEAGVTLDASLDPEDTLRALATLLVPRVAEWCVLDLVENGHFRRITAAHFDPARQPLLEELRERYPPRLDSPQPAAEALRRGTAILHRGLTRETLRPITVDEAHVELLLRLGTRSSITVPLETRDQRVGTLSLVCGERDFDETDVALTREIASRAARALENARLYEAALAANRAKADFLAVMSHELRTPLNAILGYTDLLLSGVAGNCDPSQVAFLQRVDASAQHLLALIEEILIYAQTAEGRAEIHLSRHTVGELMDDAVQLAEPLAQEKGLELRVAVDAEARPAPLRTDVGKLRQVLLHLVRNAVKFTPQGWVGLSARVEGEWMSIAVSDSGIGMNEADLEQIFLPFQQTDQAMTRRRGGTGLGLAIARDLARLLGGELEVESEPGRGTTFTLRVRRELEEEGQ